MGSFRLTFQAVGGHGCNRTAKEGEEARGCGRMGCPDCECKRVVDELKARFPSVERATLTHWPDQPDAVTDDLSGRVPRRVDNDFFNSKNKKAE
jgi:hypothetical protein